MRTINRLPKKEGFIFSVYQDGQDNAANITAHAKLIDGLKAKQIPFKEVDGVYTYDNGVKSAEKAVYVQPGMFIELDMLKNVVESECFNANQESYLELTNEREASLVPIDSKGQTVKLGVFTAVSEHEAKASEAYTYDPLTRTYFICK
jgi:hypothetical protein